MKKKLLAIGFGFAAAMAAGTASAHTGIGLYLGVPAVAMQAPAPVVVSDAGYYQPPQYYQAAPQPAYHDGDRHWERERELRLETWEHRQREREEHRGWDHRDGGRWGQDRR